MAYDPDKVTFFAQTDARGQNTPFGIKARDRTRHMYVIGKTGMGKSTLLENMAIQDIQSGEGLAFIDPHGSTAEKILEYVPPERIDDVLYFAPFDIEHPVSFNVMEDVGPDKRHLVVSGLMSTFKKIWVDAWSARMEYILSNTLLALLEYPDSTLLGVNRMLSDKAYRDAVVDNITDPSVKSFWVDEFAKYNERYMQEAGDSIKNKIGQFTANPIIRNIVGQPKSSFNMRAIMDERKILVMNLSKGLVGETNANLLGSMLITRIYLSAMSRADLSAHQLDQMPNYYFYVDEFQSFANETFANILSEARKYKLNLIIAHQYIEQMEEEVRNAVFGNVGTTIAFRVGPFDAEVLETIFSPKFMAADLVNLGFAQIYLTLMIDGIGSRPFSAVTLPPIDPPHISHKDQIVAASRAKFSFPRAEVEESIHAWHAPIQKKREEKPAQRQEPKQDQRQDQRPDQKREQSSTSRPSAPPKAPMDRQRESEQSQTKSEQMPKKRQDDRPRRQPERSGGHESQNVPPPRERKEHDLSELRNVLRDISGADTDSRGTAKKDGRSSDAGGKEKKQHIKEQKKENKEGSGNDLRSALAAALAAREQETPQRETKQENKKNDDERTSATPASGEQLQKRDADASQQPAPKAPEHTSQPAARDSGGEVSARQLERMLRVTGNDNPPFRL